MSLYKMIHLLKKKFKKQIVPFCFLVSRDEVCSVCTVFVTGKCRATLGGKKVPFETFLRCVSIVT